MIRILATYKLYILGIMVGVIGGLVYWNFVGCISGTCLITSNPYRSMGYFGLMGALLFGLFKKDGKKKRINENQ